MKISDNTKRCFLELLGYVLRDISDAILVSLLTTNNTKSTTTQGGKHEQG